MYSDLLLRGFKPENILFMTYTSEVTSEFNPFKGMIFTDPAETTDGDWAKYGCFEHVDYTDKDISAEVFLGIISGDAQKVAELTGKENPKVMNYTPEDTLFTYFIDHGSPGFIFVGEDGVYAYDLSEAMRTAHEKKLYGKWVWFMEACYSGSMFMDLPADWNVYIMTSADEANSAEMSNCPPEDVVAGQSFDTCLAGLWDNYWMEYAEQNPDTTIGALFDAVQARVREESMQNVSQFGDMSYRDLPLSDFFGKPTTKKTSSSSSSFTSTTKHEGRVPVDQVPLHLAKWKAIRSHPSTRNNALADLEKEVSIVAKREVELMRLGSALMSEKDADRALKGEVNSAFNSACVANLQQSLVKHCGHPATPGKQTMNMLRSICKVGRIVPDMNWSEICLA